MKLVLAVSISLTLMEETVRAFQNFSRYPTPRSHGAPFPARMQFTPHSLYLNEPLQTLERRDAEDARGLSLPLAGPVLQGGMGGHCPPSCVFCPLT